MYRFINHIELSSSSIIAACLPPLITTSTPVRKGWSYVIRTLYLEESSKCMYTEYYLRSFAFHHLLVFIFTYIYLYFTFFSYRCDHWVKYIMIIIVLTSYLSGRSVHINEHSLNTTAELFCDIYQRQKCAWL